MRVRRALDALSDQGGATAIEYAFLASLVAVVIVVAVEAVGLSLIDVFESVAGGLQTNG